MTQFSKTDHHMMARAIQLAKRGEYTTAPNPNVGCVISDNQGVILGEGWHKKAGMPHAEVHALEQAGIASKGASAKGASAKGASAKGASAKGSHYGRTPPCAEALIGAGVTRVVAAMVDPNPLVSGKGLRKLQDAGIITEHGLLQAGAEQLNRGFIKRMRTGKPWVTVKLAASLDGKTALANGLSQWITGPLARQDVQRYRAKSCAILSGSGTVIADNPMLNVRYAELNLADDVLAQADLRQPLRVLLDGRNQLPPSLSCLQPFENHLAGNILLVNGKFNEHPFAPHVSQWQAPFNGNKLDLNKVITKLGEMQLNQIWVEAGAKLAGALLQNKLIDELILYQAPKLIGGTGQNLFDTITIEVMDEVVDLTWADIRQVGDDIKMTALFNH